MTVGLRPLPGRRVRAAIWEVPGVVDVRGPARLPEPVAQAQRERLEGGCGCLRVDRGGTVAVLDTDPRAAAA